MEEHGSSMDEILFKNTGITLDKWISMLSILNLRTKEDIVQFLVEHEGLTHRTATFIAFKAIRYQKRAKEE
ncbi:hypothetical protein [Fontibacter flavus]|uniref:DUF3606 domain-containing protein n=1 Tax=Fontibacter flavus TaxID=654838 RepID=A0ABV6FWZ6_9BACT|nr:hypothetical protein [Cyclobacteriaceae bacterium]